MTRKIVAACVISALAGIGLVVSRSPAAQAYQCKVINEPTGGRTCKMVKKCSPRNSRSCRYRRVCGPSTREKTICF